MTSNHSPLYANKTSADGKENACLLSVVVPCYNARATIQRTISNLYTELAGNVSFEILVIDDGSTDDSASIVRELAAAHGEIKYFRKENEGVSSARNEGIELAKGEYIWFFDADDILFSGSLNVALDILRNYSPDILKFSSVTVDATNISSIERYSNIDRSKISFKGTYGDFLMKGRKLANFLVWTQVVRRSILVDRGIRFDLKLYFAEDTYFNLILAKECADCSYIETNLKVVKYMVNENSAVNTTDPARNRKGLNAFLALYDYVVALEKEDLPHLRKSIANQKNVTAGKIITRFLSCQTCRAETKRIDKEIKSKIDATTHNGKIFTTYRVLSATVTTLMLSQWVYRHIFLKHIKPRLGRN